MKLSQKQTEALRSLTAGQRAIASRTATALIQKGLAGYAGSSGQRGKTLTTITPAGRKAAVEGPGK